MTATKLDRSDHEALEMNIATNQQESNALSLWFGGGWLESENGIFQWSHLWRETCFCHIIGKVELLTDICDSFQEGYIEMRPTVASVGADSCSTAPLARPPWPCCSPGTQTEAPLFYRTMLTGNIIHSHDSERAREHTPSVLLSFLSLTHTTSPHMQWHDQNTHTHQDAIQQIKLRKYTHNHKALSVMQKTISFSSPRRPAHKVGAWQRPTFNIYCRTWQCIQPLHWLF